MLIKEIKDDLYWKLPKRVFWVKSRNDAAVVIARKLIKGELKRISKLSVIDQKREKWEGVRDYQFGELVRKGKRMLSKKYPKFFPEKCSNSNKTNHSLWNSISMGLIAHLKSFLE